MPARTVAAVAVVAILIGLLAVAVVMLARRSTLLTIGVAVALLAATAWVIFIWPAYWD